MRILLLSDRIPPENAGGAEKIAWGLARGLRDSGHDVQVIAATAEESFEEVREGIPTYHLHSRYPERFQPYYMLYNPQTAAALRTRYARIQPDVINAHVIHSHLSYYSLTLAKRMGIRAVFSAHDVMPFTYGKLTHFVNPTQCQPQDYRLPPFYNLRLMRLRYNPLRNIVIRHILKNHVHGRTCVSQAHRTALEVNGLPPFQVVYNGIDPQQFNASPPVVENLREKLGLTGRKVILFAGRLTPHKGSLQLLAALEKVIEHVPQATVLALSRASLEEQVPQYRHWFGKHLVSGGWLEGETLAAAYQLVSVAVMPSITFESFGMVSLEAMAARKPVICTCFGAPPEVVQDGVTGFVVNPFDTAAFASALERLLTDDALAQKMGSAGYERMTQHFSLQRQLDAMLQVYGSGLR